MIVYFRSFINLTPSARSMKTVNMSYETLLEYLGEEVSFIDGYDNFWSGTLEYQDRMGKTVTSNVSVWRPFDGIEFSVYVDRHDALIPFLKLLSG